MTDDDAAFRDHIVVFGFHGVGRRIVRQLIAAGQRVVVIDPEADPTEQEDLQRWGAHYLAGYGHSQDTLHIACVTTARAVLCVTEDDVRNTRLALLVRDLSPQVRLVVRMANSSVGRAMRTVTEPGEVLNVAELASSSFVEAALGRTMHEVVVDGTPFYVASVDRAGSSNEANHAPGLTVIDTSVEGRQTVFGTADSLRTIGIDTSAGVVLASRPSLRRRIREGFGAVTDAVDRPFRIAFGILLLLAFASVAVLMIGYEETDGTRMNLLDALYFTSETIAAVGFGDFYFRDQDAWLRVWAVVLILLGIVLVTLSTALLTNALVTRRLQQSLGRQRVTGMRDHIVVVGLGAVGSKVATDLRSQGYEVAVIDGGEGERFLPQMRTAGIPVLFGDATLPETQASAGVHRAAGVAVLTSDDLINIETGLAVRGVVGERPVPIVLRVFSKNLARVIAGGLDAGIARSIAELSAPWFVGAALGLDVFGTFYVGSRLFIALRVPVRAGEPLDGAEVQSVGAAVVAVRCADDERLLHPPAEGTVLRPGDSAYVVGVYDDLLGLLTSA